MMMGGAIEKRIGNYHYQDGWLIKKQLKIDDKKRTFIVLIAAAYNAFGLIGSEHNGIVILDDDKKQVVLDQHIREDTGYYGPSKYQKAEFERIAKMDELEFAEFCADHPNYRKDCGSFYRTPHFDPNNLQNVWRVRI